MEIRNVEVQNIIYNPDFKENNLPYEPTKSAFGLDLAIVYVKEAFTPSDAVGRETNLAAPNTTPRIFYYFELIY